MLSANLIIRLFDAANMQRWNDQLRPVELRELDKQAHKMIIAYVLGNIENENGEHVEWIEIIEGGFFEYLERLVTTDIKPKIFHQIKNSAASDDLHKYVIKELEPILNNLNSDLEKKFKAYLHSGEHNLNRQILGAAHFLATEWEFKIIKKISPERDQKILNEIGDQLKKEFKRYELLKSVRIIREANSKYNEFINICGRLRFQVRWSHLHREPRTSVLGHMLTVAQLSYLLSLEINSCRKRLFNNYFSGLFHDLPEVLTRDIINPLKKNAGIEDKLKEIEKKEMLSIYKLVPKLERKLKLFTEDEFTDCITKNGKEVSFVSGLIPEQFNKDNYNPRDGTIIKAADKLAAFTEAWLAIKNGSVDQQFSGALHEIRNQFTREPSKDKAFDSFEKKIRDPQFDFKRIFSTFV